jgi:prepilin-type N-terminal cleavage/methylation domain-containing protein
MRTAPKSGFSRAERSVAVDWRDHSWCPVIVVQSRWGEAPDEPSSRHFDAPRPARGDQPSPGCGATGARPAEIAGHAVIRFPRATKPLLLPSLFRPLRRHPVYLKTMKNDPYRSSRFRAGFTIVELLTVISIIAILAAMLLPVLAAAKKHAQKVQAQTEIQGIVTAIEAYDSAYGRFPVSTNAQIQAQANAQVPGGNPDFTYGAIFQKPGGTTPVGTLIGGVPVTNAEVIAILMDVTNYGNGQPVLANLNYQKNPQQTIFLNAKVSGYDPSQPGQAVGGVDVTGAYRDPWGNPYVITMDLNYDEQCQDAFYGLSVISQPPPPPANSNPGLNGLVNPDGTPDNYRYHGKVMVWSAGPDGKVDPGASATTSANKDNVLSWQ